jgi:hypothetical protein
MATAIGQNIAQYAAFSGGSSGAAQLAAAAAARGVRLGQANETGRPTINPSATGLQEGAINGPSAAQRTIVSGVESARKIVPNVEDILDIQRQRVADSEAARRAQLEEARAQEEESTQDTERLLPEPSREAARFNEARATREDAEAASVSLGDRIAPEPRETARPEQEAPGARLNVLV